MFSIFRNKSEPGKNLAIRDLLKKNLNFNGFYWYPLHSEPKSSVMEYFEADVFENEFGNARLKSLLRDNGYNHLWLISEFGQDELVTVDEIDSYGGEELIFCGADAEWAIYFSHENTITFAGELLYQL